MRHGLRWLVLAFVAVLAAACSGDGGGGATEHQGSSGDPAPAQQSAPDGVVRQYSLVQKEIREAGGETTIGQWRIGYIVEMAEPWYETRDGQQVFREPAPGETHHIEIIPFEAKTGRIVPEVPIRLEILDGSGTVVDAAPLNFYYSDFFHYASNFRIPQPGTYTLRATLEAPSFLRHGEAGQAPPLTQGVTATFPDVELKPEG